MFEAPILYAAIEGPVSSQWTFYCVSKKTSQVHISQSIIDKAVGRDVWKIEIRFWFVFKKTEPSKNF